jgi:putative hydrolase of the HAD superfamily
MEYLFIMISKFKGIFFDAGNTLLRVYPSIGVIYSEAARMYGTELSPDLIEASFRNLWTQKDSLVSNEGHRNTYEKERDWWKYLVREVFRDHMLDQNFESFFDYLYGRFAGSDCWRLYDDVLEVLQSLKGQGLKLAIISNWDSRLPTLCDELGLTPFFDAVIVSSMVGYEKPHPGIFQVALSKTSLAPQEALYIGDDPYLDYQAALNAGLYSLHLDRYDRFPDHPQKIQTLRQLLTEFKTELEES